MGSKLYFMDFQNIMAAKLHTPKNMTNSLSSAEGGYQQSVWPIWAYALGLMVMPDNLALWGQFAGQVGIFAPLILVAGLLIYLSYATTYIDLNPTAYNTDGQRTDGCIFPETWLAYYPLVIRVLAGVFLATGLTVSSGYVFNEVFVYWFPNFAFAFILLGGLVGLQFLSKTYRHKAQIVFVGTVIAGLTVLIIVGLTTGLFQLRVPAVEEQPMAISGLFLPLLLLLGFDNAVIPAGKSSGSSTATAKLLKSAIAVFAGIMIFWVITARLHVDGLRLAHSSIAHLITAREIGGQAGRVLMGVMIIAGTLAAVNALFESVARLIQSYSQRGLLPQIRLLPKVAMLSMAAVAALLMTTGLAGEELLENLIRATLLMWLGKYGLITARRLWGTPQTDHLEQATPHGQNRLQLAVTALVTFTGILVLALTNDRPMLIMGIIFISICTVLIFGGIYKMFASRSR